MIFSAAEINLFAVRDSQTYDVLGLFNMMMMMMVDMYKDN